MTYQQTHTPMLLTRDSVHSEPSRGRLTSDGSDDFRLAAATGADGNDGLDNLGANASVPYASLHPPSRPLEFPSPTVSRAYTCSDYVKDHRSGNVFYATSVLTRKTVHGRGCPNREVSLPKKDSKVRNNNSTHGTTIGSNAGKQSIKESSACPCGPSCTLPTKAYCVRRKLCDTVFGSVRLCVVLKRSEKNGDEEQSFGRAVWETTEMMVAIKVINWSKLQQLRGRHLEDPLKELACMQLLGNYHPHVISLSDSLQDEAHLFCIYPFLSGGDLYGRLWEEMTRSPTGRIDEHRARRWFRQILSALSHLQKKGVCHRDLCMENMMVDHRDDVHIIDFGLCLRVPYVDPANRNLVTDVSSNTVRRLMKAQGQGGKWEYMAPEVAGRRDFDGFAIDLWAVGIVLFEFLIGKKPFAMPDASDKNFYTIAIEEDLQGLLRTKGIALDNEACDLLQKMLRCDPTQRLTLAEVVNHPWVNRGYMESNPRKILSPVEETNNRWFIQNNAINENDLNEYELALRLRINSCSSNDAMDDATADSTDEESRNPRGRLSNILKMQSLPYNLSKEQLVQDNQCKINETHRAAHNEEQPSSMSEDEMIARINTTKKKKGFTSYLKNPKKLWKNHTKKPLTTIVSAASSSDDETPKTEMRGDGRMC